MLACMADRAALMRAVGAKIADARKPHSQSWVGAQVGRKQGAVSKWEKGEAMPPQHLLPELERVLGMEPGELTALAYGSTPPADARAAEVKAALDAVTAIRRHLDQVERALRGM